MKMKMVDWVSRRNMEPKSKFPLFNFELIADTVQYFLTYHLHLFEDVWVFNVTRVFYMGFGDDQDVFDWRCLIDVGNHKVFLILVMNWLLIRKVFIAKDAFLDVCWYFDVKCPIFYSSQHDW